MPDSTIATVAPAPLLKHAALLRQQAFIGGAWVDATTQRRFAVVDPATGNPVAHVPDMGRADVVRAIAAADAALPAWRGKTAKERGVILRRWFDLIVAHQDDLAAIMTAEQGKPLPEARGEVLFGASFIDWFAEEAKRAYGDVIPTYSNDRRILVLKQPVGVVAAITPWNFPSAMVTRKCGPALAAGCTLVLKPAEDTPLSALALAALVQEAGLPPGVLNVITSSAAGAPEVGGELCSNPVVRKLSFTGSTEVGKLLMRQAAGTMKKLSLELGGSAPFIVFADADLDRAVMAAMASKFRASGQTCTCSNRFFIQDDVYDAFADKFVRAVEALRVAPGTVDGSAIGPLINADAVAKVDAHVVDARKRGARILTGGRRHALGGGFYEPTVLADATTEMLVCREETFGPVAPLVRFKTEADAIRLANDTRYGLAGYFFTRDLARAWRVAEALEFGSVAINEGSFASEIVPVGGFKESGVGREGSKYGIADYLEIKQVCVGGLT
ncbi:NAD-dependent succinate-semialdehyde dehydrogenase [Reyranella sp. CPCC 100927]|uniref:NAD-dependent succinate-semialdehyde dehydrogenase n=1 Tax=Reyranella sp. CPCC 100927 TaxID=2599616 RepID=UPI0011B47093|nr:NAD-dependent succinate-semialdehyde dehydrogenase [Reyranella sp. CPCC 100927]TWT10564.1 NAD-dependent succinate-semialdehyde dehydrogenase [Reyranella sp. CPCC 100927]